MQSTKIPFVYLVPTRITDAAELCLPGSPVAAAPAVVPSAVTEPTGETKATDTLQVEPTGKILVMDY